ncbi:LamG-like jellyroll fold domain-containing protein [Actinoplanes sp. NPDC049681]|uniref:LamG-like jellyroll fold domain-containing protein n=1 Tax=Actinoplanes sp. NPDC049681 TaxID=3363905 RepID=UPI00378B51A5
MATSPATAFAERRPDPEPAPTAATSAPAPKPTAKAPKSKKAHAAKKAASAKKAHVAKKHKAPTARMIAACDTIGAPTNVTVTAGPNSATATWQAPSLGTPTSYIVSAVSGSRQAGAKAVPASVLTATLTGLTATAHTVTVTAVADCGAGPGASGAPVTPTGSGTPYAATVLTDAPVAYYRLGEASYSGSAPTLGADSSGNGNPLSYGYAATVGAAGALVGDSDTAVNLNGGCCAGTARSDVPQYGSDRTVEAWVKPNDGYLRWVTGWGDYNTNGGFQLGLENGNVVVGTTSAEYRFPLPATIVGGGWHQIAATYSGGTLIGYLDGVALGTRTLDDPLDTATDTVLYVGAGHDGYTPFYGGLDEVSIYGTALTSTRISAHFAASGHSRPTAAKVVNAQTGEDNELIVSWGAATATGGPVNRYVVTALVGGVARNSMVVAGTKTAARMTGLGGGTGYTFRVVPGNEYGDGPAATSTTAVAPTGPATTYATSVIADNPSAYYRLGEPAGNVVGGDSSGRGKLLTYRAASGSFSKVGAVLGDADKAVQLNGSCCFGTARPLLPVNNASRTIEAWIKPADPYKRFFAGYGASDDGAAFDVGADSDTIYVRTYNDDVSMPVPTSLTDGAWHHVVVAHSATTVTFYIDGLSLGSRTLRSAPNTAQDTTFYVGSAHDGDSPYYGGLDEVAVYPAWLVPARVTAHFAASGHARPAAVTALTATPDVNQVNVSWSAVAPADGITSFLVTAMSGGVARNSVMVPGTVSTAVLTGLAGGTAYSVRVIPSNRYGDGPAATSPAVTPTGAATTYASSVLAAAPSVYYRLGEQAGLNTAANSSGDGKLLTIRSTSQTWRVAGALRGDADTAVTTDGGCCVGSSMAAMPRFDASRSIQAWVRPNDGYTRWFAGYGVSGDATAFSVGLRDSTVLVHNGNTELAIPTPRPLTDGVWHQVTVTYAAKLVTVYLDGLSVGTKQFPDILNTKTTGGPLYVGAGHSGNNPFYGGLDEVAVYPTVLTAAQIAAQFQASGHSRPAAVTGVAVTSRANALSVSWSAPAAPDGVTAYRVTALKGGVAANAIMVPGTATSAALTGLAGGTAYTVRVVGINAYGEGPAADSTTPVTPTGSGTTYATAVLADAPIAYYRLGEAAGVGSGADSAKGNTLTYGSGTRGVAGAVAGDADTAAQGDGGCCIGFSQTVAPRNNSSRTVEAWVKPTDGYLRWIAGWGRSGVDEAFNVGLGDSRIVVSAYADDLTFPIGRSLVDGAWHHVAVVAGATVATVYIDGVSLGTRTFAGELATVTSGGLRIGAAHDGSTPFYGGLDEVAVYPLGLSATQISAHFAAGGHSRPGAPTAVAAVSQANALSVSWNAASGPDGVSYYLLTAYAGGLPKNSVAVRGDATTGTLTGLAGGTAYTVQVLPVNAYGRGTAATSAAATPTGAASTYATTVLADAPSAYYRLGEAAGLTTGADSAPAGAPLTYGGSATLGLPGAVVGDTDGAVNNNSGCCPGTARNGSLPSYNSARTVEGWVKPADGYLRWMAGWGTSRTDRAFNIGLDSTRVLVSGYADDVSVPLTRPLTDGEWHHLAVTYNGATAAVYVDGLLLGTRTFAQKLNTVVPVGEGLRVGAAHDGSSPFYGDLDEVAVFPVALSATQVAAHFAASGHARPKAVTALTASAQPNAARVSWTAPSSAPDYYVVTALKAGVARNSVVVAGNVTTALVTGLPGGVAHTIRVTGVNAYGDGPAVTSSTVTPTGAATTYASTVLADAPAAYYRLGEATGLKYGADSAGGPLVTYGSAGTLGGSGAVPADPDLAVTVNGSCCLGNVRAKLPVNNAARSVEAWVKPSDTWQRWLAGWGTSAVDRSFNVGVQGDGILVSAYGDDLSFTAPSSIADGLWHHVVVTYSAGAATAYLDGVKVGTQSFSHSLNTGSATTGLRLGSTHDGGGAYYGALDEVAVYPTALTAAQVSAHYQAGIL